MRRLAERLTALRRSLSLRIGAAIMAALLGVVLGLQAVTLALDDTGVVTMLALQDAPLLPASVVAGPDGALALRPTAALRAALAANPQAQVAVVRLADGAVLPGGSPGMAAVLEAAQAHGLDPVNWNTMLLQTPDGPVLLLVHARDWTWAELPAALRVAFTEDVVVLALIGAAVGALAVLAARTALGPLRQAAALAERLRLRDFDGRIDDRAMPTEVAPFVRAVNAMLDRLDGEIGRQRRFVANAAHELRTPLSVLRARIDAAPDPALRAALTADADRIAALVRQMLAVARLGDLDLPMDEDIDLPALARRVVADWAPVAIARGRALAFDAAPAPGRLRGNAQAIENALANLIDNALHAEPHGGVVEIAVRDGPAASVSDHGAGLDAAAQAAMFEPFWRGDPARPGTGLGLVVVREAVRLHGGTVEVVSAPGAGATITLRFGAGGSDEAGAGAAGWRAARFR